MPLPHFTQLQMTGSPGGPGSNPEEVVYLNLFEITFVLPTILQAQGRDPIILLQQATSVPMNLTEKIEVATQNFKFSTRAYMKTPSQTHVEFDINFNVNVNDRRQMTVWNSLKAWYDLVWNSQNGTTNYKADLIGTIIVDEHDKRGAIIRRVTYQNAQITALKGIDLDWKSQEIWDDVTASFVADYWLDEYNDLDFTVTPPIIPGY